MSPYQSFSIFHPKAISIALPWGVRFPLHGLSTSGKDTLTCTDQSTVARPCHLASPLVLGISQTTLHCWKSLGQWSSISGTLRVRWGTVLLLNSWLGYSYVFVSSVFNFWPGEVHPWPTAVSSPWQLLLVLCQLLFTFPEAAWLEVTHRYTVEQTLSTFSSSNQSS